MKGKLIKTDVNFLLEDDKGVVIASTSLNKEGLSLSQKNCQAIELGYDLDELAMGYDLYENINFVGQMRAFKAGFQKALELMGDKKFSEEDVREAIEIARNGSMQEQHNGYGRPTESRFVLDNLPSDKIIQSLQQTEWDVEIVEECLDKNCDGVNKKGECITTGKPKLGEDGCLILKKL
jgi:hypothetical protein